MQGCKTGAKWSTLYTEIPRAEATGNLDLRIQSRAIRIEHGADGRVNAVVYRDPEGHEQRQKARIVCVACNSVETARLLLLSESSKFPHGLANSSDQVGRNYCLHTGGFVWGIFEKPIHFWRGATLAGHRRGRDQARSQARLRGRLSPGARGAGPAEPAARRASPYDVGARARVRHGSLPSMAGMFVNGEDMPRANNRITLNPKVKDRFGLPVANIHMDDHENNAAMRTHAQRQAKSNVRSGRREPRGQLPPDSGNAQHVLGAHEQGSARRRVERARPDARHQNLFISDGSAMSHRGSANPTLTIVSLALRQAEFIEREMSAKNI